MALIPMGESVTVIRPGTITYDIYGNDSPGPAVEFDIGGCAFAPGASGEQTQGADQITTGPTLYAPYAADIRATDRIRIRGLVYEVTGTPAAWKNPLTGWEAGLAVTLRRVTG